MRRRRRVKARVKYNMLLITTVTSCLIALFEVFSFVSKVNAKQIVIADNNMRLTYETSHKDVESFFKANDIKLNENDRVNVELDKEIEDGMLIEIQRAVEVNLTVNNEKKKVLSSAKTVSEFLDENDIKMTPYDDINVDLSTQIRTGLNIEIFLYNFEERVVTEALPYETIYENDTTLKKGEEIVRREGITGIREATYKVRFLDDKEVGKELVSQTVIEPAVNKIVRKGMLDSYVAPNGKTYKVTKVLTMNSTAYSNSIQDTGKTPEHPLYGITRSGLKTQRGIVAVDPKVIPLMTKLYVEGYGEAIAADTGSAIKGNKIDLFYDTRQEALKYGRKNIKVYVLAE